MWANKSQWDSMNPLIDSTVFEWKRPCTLEPFGGMMGEPACIWGLWMEEKPHMTTSFEPLFQGLQLDFSDVWASKLLICLNLFGLCARLISVSSSTPPPLVLYWALSLRVLTFKDYINRLPLPSGFLLGLANGRYQQEIRESDEIEVRVFIPLACLPPCELAEG